MNSNEHKGFDWLTGAIAGLAAGLSIVYLIMRWRGMV